MMLRVWVSSLTYGAKRTIRAFYRRQDEGGVGDHRINLVGDQRGDHVGLRL
jgi:hypothetical protein